MCNYLYEPMKGKLELFKLVEDTPGMTACLSVFWIEILAKQCDAFYVRVNKNLTINQKRRLKGQSTRDLTDFRASSAAYEPLTDHDLRVALKGESNISKPVMSRALLSPVFVVAVPIKDTNGKVNGVLAGVVDLGKHTFLDKITEQRYGNTGGYLLIAPQHKLFVTATDKSRIMKPLPAPGINRMHDRYMNGFDGFGLAMSSRGIEELTAAKHVPVAGWFVVATLPAVEAFAPIRTMQQNMLFATIVLTFLVGGLTWWMFLSMLRLNLSPMLAAAKLLETYSGTSQLPQPIPVTNQNEIGQLIGAFNSLLETVEQREESLRGLNDKIREQYDDLQMKDESLCTQNDNLLATEEMLRAQIKEYETSQKLLKKSEAKFAELLDNTKIQLWAFDGTSYSYSNKEWFDFTGQNPDSPLTIERWVSVLHPEDAEISGEVWLKNWKSKTEHDNYFRLRRHDGVYRDFYCHAVPIIDEHGVFQYLQGFNLDITVRKQVEEERRQLEHQFHQAQKLESLGVLAGGIAHDFNNILTVITGHCYMAREDMIPEDEYKAVFHTD